MIEEEFGVKMIDYPDIRKYILDSSNFIQRIPEMISEVVRVDDMNLRQEWMSDYEYFDGDYPNNVFIDDVKASYERRKSGTDGKSGKIDSVSATFVAQNHTNPLNKAKYDKKLLVDSTQSIHTGSVVEFDSKKWLVTNKIFDRQAYKVTSVNEIIVFLSLV